MWRAALIYIQSYMIYQICIENASELYRLAKKSPPLPQPWLLSGVEMVCNRDCLLSPASCESFSYSSLPLRF